jgi:hypothetical protein
MLARRKLLLHGALAAALYCVAALVYLRPIAQVYSNHIAPDPGDPIFTLYVLKWVLHQAHLGFPDLWNANVFFPAKGALAFSDPFLGPAMEIYFFKNAITGYNFLFFTSFVLTGLGVWWMLVRNGASSVAALLAGAMYAFSPFRFSHLNHLSMLLGQWIPFALWSFDRLLAEPRPRRAALFLLFYGLNLTSGCYFAYMIHFPLLALLVSRWLVDRRAPRSAGLLRPAALKVLLPVALLAGAAAFAQFLPFLELSHRINMKRDEREVVKNAAALSSYASPAPENRYSMYSPHGLWERASLPVWQQPFVRSENALFPGFLATLFGAVGLAAFWRRYRIHGGRRVSGWRRLVRWGLVAVALLAFAVGDVYTLHLNLDTFLTPWLPVVSRGLWIGLGLAFAGSLSLWAFLGRRWRGSDLLAWRAMEPWERGLALSGLACFLLSFPLVYVPMMAVVPGMNGMRVPARFDAFLGITIVFFAARGLDGFLSRWSRPLVKTALVAVLAVALFAELQPRPIHWIAILPQEEFPDVYGWIAGQKDIRSLIEIPMRAYWHETPYMYYSTLHWKPIAHGYSSFIPPGYDRLSNQVLRFLPDAAAVDLMTEMGISHMVVHVDDLGGSWRRAKDPMEKISRWEERLEGRVELVHDADPDRVYRIVRTPAILPQQR